MGRKPDVVPALPPLDFQICTGCPGGPSFTSHYSSNIFLDNIQLPPGLSRVKIIITKESNGSGFNYSCTYYNFSEDDFTYISNVNTTYWDHPTWPDYCPYFGGIYIDGKDDQEIILSSNLFSYGNEQELTYSFSKSLADDYYPFNYDIDDNYYGIDSSTFKLESATSVKTKN